MYTYKNGKIEVFYQIAYCKSRFKMKSGLFLLTPESITIYKSIGFFILFCIFFKVIQKSFNTLHNIIILPISIRC